MKQCCKKKDPPLNKKWILLSAGLFTCSVVGSYIGGWASNPSDEKMVEVADSLQESTQILVSSVNKIVPVVDAVDTNVQTLTKKVDDLKSLTPQAVEIHGMEQLMASIERLEKKVGGMDTTLIKHDKNVSIRGGALLSKTEKISSSYQDLYNRLNQIWIKDPDTVWETGGGREVIIQDVSLNEAKRVLCVNRLGKTRCLPGVEAVSPSVERGKLRECLFYQSRLECGPSKAIN
jgi:hypothetical protein